VKKAVLRLTNELEGVLEGPRGGQYAVESLGGEYAGGILRRWFDVKGRPWVVAVDTWRWWNEDKPSRVDVYFARSLSVSPPKWNIELADKEVILGQYRY